MYKVLATAEDILLGREDMMRGVINPVIDSAASLYFRPNKNPQRIVLTAYQGIPGIGPAEVFTESRLKTVVPDYLASYYEIWNRDYEDQNEIFYLHKAYFHIYWIHPDEGEKEYLLLHCDPNEPDDAAHAKYKQAPHLHMEILDPPWPKAHIALNSGYLSHVLADANSLSLALKEAVEMLAQEIMTPLLELWAKKQ